MRLPDFYIPSNKAQMVAWLGLYYPVNNQGETIRWGVYTAAKIKAIYIKQRKKLEKENASRSKEEAEAFAAKHRW